MNMNMNMNMTHDAYNTMNEQDGEWNNNHRNN